MSMAFFIFVAAAQGCAPYVIPDQITACLSANRDVSMVTSINPAYLKGDFDSDGCDDYVFLAQPAGARILVAVCWGSGGLELIEPDQFAAALPGMSWNFDGWAEMDRAQFFELTAEELPPVPIGDTVEIIWAERASGFLYRSTDGWYWVQFGD